MAMTARAFMKHETRFVLRDGRSWIPNSESIPNTLRSWIPDPLQDSASSLAPPAPSSAMESRHRHRTPLDEGRAGCRA
jgi:hypothetical protein